MKTNETKSFYVFHKKVMDYLKKIEKTTEAPNAESMISQINEYVKMGKTRYTEKEKDLLVARKYLMKRFCSVK